MVAAESAATRRCISDAEATQRHLRDGALLEARTEAASCAAPTCPAVVQADCHRWFEEASTQVPSVIVTARDAAGHDVVRADLVIDGRAVGGALDGLPIELNPGAHELRVSVGQATVAETVVLAVAEKNRQVRLTLPSEKRTDEGSSAPMWIAFGASAASGALAAGFGLAAISKYDSLEGSCGNACPHSEVVVGERYALVANVALGTAIVAGGLGLWFLLRRPPPRIATRPGLLAF